jgi:ribonuclease HI
VIILVIEHSLEEPKLLIISDNQMVLKYCKYAKRKGKLAHHNERLFKALQKFKGNEIQSSYIPAHKGIEGNKKADKVAKTTTEPKPEEEEAIISYIKEELKKTRKRTWLKWFDEKQYTYRPNTKTYHQLKS